MKCLFHFNLKEFQKAHIEQGTDGSKELVLEMDVVQGPLVTKEVSDYLLNNLGVMDTEYLLDKLSDQMNKEVIARKLLK